MECTGMEIEDKMPKTTVPKKWALDSGSKNRDFSKQNHTLTASYKKEKIVLVFSSFPSFITTVTVWILLRLLRVVWYKGSKNFVQQLSSIIILLSSH